MTALGTRRSAALLSVCLAAFAPGQAVAHSDASSFDSGSGMHDHAVDHTTAPRGWPGRIVYDPRRVYDISMKVNARILDVTVGPVGTAVKKGQPLARFSSAELNTLQNTFVETVRNASLMMAASVTGETKLIEGRMNLIWRGMSDAEVTRIEQARKPISEIGILAPVAGVLTQIDVAAGRLVSAGTRDGLFSTAGTRVFAIAEPDALMIEAMVPPDIAAGLAVGDRLQMSLTGLDATSGNAEVVEIPPLIGPAGWRHLIRLTPLDDTMGGGLRANQIVLLTLVAEENAAGDHHGQEDADDAQDSTPPPPDEAGAVHMPDPDAGNAVEMPPAVTGASP